MFFFGREESSISRMPKLNGPGRFDDTRTRRWWPGPYPYPSVPRPLPAIDRLNAWDALGGSWSRSGTRKLRSLPGPWRLADGPLGHPGDRRADTPGL